MGYGAAWVADRLEVGGIRLTGVPVTINQAPMSTSLLGMNFLNRLEAFEFRGRQLILKWRDDA
jgi:aspartyl protease family protein